MPQGLTTGIIGCMIFGLGLYLAMRVIGSRMMFGILLGVCGVVVMVAAYPIYRSVFRKAKAQHTPRILELAAELSNEAI